MNNMRKAAYALLAGASIHSGAAFAQDASVGTEDNADAAEIVVTAQKRSERINDVPMSIAALSGDQLKDQGVNGVADLSRAVPGFSFQPSDFGTPVYTIRGVGQKDNAAAISPTVSVYLDQVPLPFSVMTAGAALDLERAEVLKGPQGTLFGQNSTGGAINFIARKPTGEFAMGGELGFGRFGQADAEIFVSGPLAENLRARVAVRTEQRGDWQVSQTRNETLGQRNFTTGRLLLDWTPSETIRFQFSANGWLDKSDTQAAQFVAFKPAKVNGYQDVYQQLAAYAPTPDDARLADWDPATALRKDDKFGQVSLRSDFEISDAVTLTSITAFSSYSRDAKFDPDGTYLKDSLRKQTTSIESFSQELRLAGQGDRIKWMIGANYQSDVSKDRISQDYLGSNSGVGLKRFYQFYNTSNQDVKTKSIFASLDYEIAPSLTTQGSIRYTASGNDLEACLWDPGDGLFAAAFSALASRPIAPGQCVVREQPSNNPVPIVKNSLNETNLSRRGWLETSTSPVPFSTTITRTSS